MVDIAAPQPRLEPSFLARRSPRTRSKPSTVVDDTFYCLPQPRAIASPPRLLSPFRLPEDAGLHKLSKPLCTPTKRRRGPIRNLSRSTRHRHCARTDCCINTISGHLTSLDDLPWISALSIEPDSTDPWDVADLSLLNTDSNVEDKPSLDGPGPVRRRKTSLRADPLAQPMTDAEATMPRLIAFPFVRRALFPQSGLLPQTPAPRDHFDPSNVVFQGLNPIFPTNIDETPRPSDVHAL